MATEYTVSGPCDIHVNTGDDWEVLGRTSNEDMARIAINRFARDKTSTASGDAPEQSVVNNQTATIAFALVAWDQTVLDAVRARAVADPLPATNKGGISTVGAVMVGGFGSQDPCTIGVRIVPRIAGRRWWEFAVCLLRGEPENIGPFGNEVQSLGMVLTGIPDPATQLLFECGTTPIA